jgi:hypothetical protein
VRGGFEEFVFGASPVGPVKDLSVNLSDILTNLSRVVVESVAYRNLSRGKSVFPLLICQTD